MQNVLTLNKSRRIWVTQIFKIDIQKRGPNYSTGLENFFPLRN